MELKRAANLKTLQLPESSELGIGFDGGPMCGNAYMGPNGYLTERYVQREHIEAVEKASSMAWAALPYLENIYIGGESPGSVERDEKGTVVKISWPWSDGVEEFLQKMYPKPQTDDEWF